MHKIAVVIYTNITTEARSPAYRAMNFVDELLRHGDDVALVFDGGGTATLAAILDPADDMHRVWLKAQPALRGACGYCAKAYKVEAALTVAAIPLLTEDKGHASLRALLDEGRQIITF
jgi:hypothetical protein